jgi:hypothetical protein
MTTMTTMTTLAKAIDSTVSRSSAILRQDYDQDGLPKEVLDLIEFGRILVRIANGGTLTKAMGAPGDWGYGTPIATALLSQPNVQAHPLGGVAGNPNEASERALGAVAARSAGAKITALLGAALWQLAATVTCAVEPVETMLHQSPTELGAAPLFALVIGVFAIAIVISWATIC